ncbi:MAG: ATP-grasp domain-containing protein [Actinomycetota bacterium]|nr:ATP-grasp domain-containing protein [Actinomycetota bacterium]
MVEAEPERALAHQGVEAAGFEAAVGSNRDDRPREVVVVGAQERDRALIRSATLDDRYRIHYAGPDLDSVTGFDPRAFLDEWTSVRTDGVVGTKDRAALLASLLAARQGLPGPTPDALINCQHKGRSRLLHREVAPTATPLFAVVRTESDRPPPCPPPWFAKPLVGRLSQGARRVDDPAELRGLTDQSGYAAAYARVAELAGLPAAAVQGFLVEELARGAEVTLEGYVHQGRVTVIGITDSVMYSGTNSFQRFEYPSALGLERQQELGELARRVVPALGFDGGFFNMEFVVPAEGPATIIEVNGRIASQFAPMVEATHGRSTYDALVALACGRDPAWRRSAPDGVAVSYVLRTFTDAFVESVPEPEEGIEILVRPGLRLSEQGTNDVESYRVAIVYGAGETRTEAIERCRARLRTLRFQLASALVA